jgi:hypothetical protein
MMEWDSGIFNCPVKYWLIIFIFFLLSRVFFGYPIPNKLESTTPLIIQQYLNSDPRRATLRKTAFGTSMD